MWQCRPPSPCPVAQQTLHTSASIPPRRSPTPCRSGWGRASCAHSWGCWKERCRGNIQRDVHRWGSIRPLHLRTLCPQQCLCPLVEPRVIFDHQCGGLPYFDCIDHDRNYLWTLKSLPWPRRSPRLPWRPLWCCSPTRQLSPTELTAHWNCSRQQLESHISCYQSD